MKSLVHWAVGPLIPDKPDLSSKGSRSSSSDSSIRDATSPTVTSQNLHTPRDSWMGDDPDVGVVVRTPYIQDINIYGITACMF